MTAVEYYRPTLLSSCALAATAAEARYRIDGPMMSTRASRVIALDEQAAGIVQRVSELPWSPGAHFLTYESPESVAGLGDSDLDAPDLDAPGVDASGVDATLRAVGGSQSLLSDELAEADVAVMVATADSGAQGASIIGNACFMRGIMTAGLVIAEGGAADEAVSALRPHAAVLVVTRDEGDVPEMLTALRA